jgi:hypothetical protein
VLTLLDVEISELIENSPDDFLKYAEMGQEEVTIRAQVLKGIPEKCTY